MIIPLRRIKEAFDGGRLVEYGQRILLGSMVVALLPLQFIGHAASSTRQQPTPWDTQLVLAQSLPTVLTPEQHSTTIIEKTPSRYAQEQAELAAQKKVGTRVATPKPSSVVAKSAPINLSDDERMQWVTQAAQTYHIPAQLLEAVLRVESGMQAYTCKANPSSGAAGPAQFMPGTWRHYAVDGNGDGRKDICDLRDAAFAAANLLASNGAAQGNYNQALLRYNNAQWYVNKVLALAGM